MNPETTEIIYCVNSYESARHFKPTTIMYYLNKTDLNKYLTSHYFVDEYNRKLMRIECKIVSKWSDNYKSAWWNSYIAPHLRYNPLLKDWNNNHREQNRVHLQLKNMVKVNNQFKETKKY